MTVNKSQGQSLKHVGRGLLSVAYPNKGIRIEGTFLNFILNI